AKGSADVALEDGFNLFGTDFSSNFKGHVSEGFKRLQFEAVQSLKIPNIEYFGDIYANVIVRVDTAKGDLVEVEVETFMPQLNVKMTVPSLDDCTPENLRKWVQD